MGLRNLFLSYCKGDTARVRVEWYKLLRHFANIHDLHMYRHHVTWPDDEPFNTAAQDWSHPGLPLDRRFFVFSAARSVRHLLGDTVDVGVRYGTSSHFILNATDNTNKHHHLFDSFAGLNNPGHEDRGTGIKQPWKKGDLAVDEAVCRNNLKAYPNCHFYKGWIPSRFHEVSEKTFSFVHVDVDLFEATRDTLEFFYPRLTPGGILLCDDYGFSSTPGAKKAMDEFFADKPEEILQIPTGQAMITKLT